MSGNQWSEGKRAWEGEADTDLSCASCHGWFQVSKVTPLTGGEAATCACVRASPLPASLPTPSAARRKHLQQVSRLSLACYPEDREGIRLYVLRTVLAESIGGTQML